ncbi:hypothetical protein HPT27_09785 [Permianibacter sp. IMCC34836]|uniref:sensor domain-containing protein n=1 Tax=Permianibacter fluminis TaxID=2738515 RepID=UPI001552B581|nr:sensor domain-containing protein [Permianibacter fluminis]NQD37318.1 hypothetical protein [Permianibacter fluminis]
MSHMPISSIADYLSTLRTALSDADPALLQDALYDAEEYLRAASADQPGKTEAEIVADALNSFGTPDEIAASYRETETTVARALRTPAPKAPSSLLGKIFGVYADPHTYASLFYMMLTMATGIFYFTWAITGAAMSAGFAILIIGVPFFLLFIGSVRLISLVEGRIVEVLLGERMPRRPLYPTSATIGQRILGMLKDVRTWSTLLYMVAMMPVGIVYFTAAICGLAVSIGLMLAPFIDRFPYTIDDGSVVIFGLEQLVWPASLLWLPVGFLCLTLVLHAARLLGRVHGKVAKHLLVKMAA